MELKNHWFSVTKSALEQLLHSVNLRPEEVERTWLMFIFYTTVSVGYGGQKIVVSPCF